MELEIGGKNYKLEFGLEFISQLDNMYTQNSNGVEFGIGVEMMATYLEMGRPTVLLSIIKAATGHLKSKPSNKDIESYLADEFNAGNGDKLFAEFKENTEQSPFLRETFKKMNEQIELVAKKPTNK